MVNISKSGNAIKFEFTDSDHYLYGNGEVEVPVNSLSLVIDESKFVVFKKAATNDTFITFDPANSNLSDKAGVIEFYKTNMVGSSGGGSESGITSGDVQTMIDISLEDYYTDDEVDAALSGKASVSDVTAVANDVSTVSGQVETKVATSDFNAYSAATYARIAEDEEVTAAALNDLNDNKQDTLVYYEEDTEGDGWAGISIQNDNGEGNTAEYWFDIGSGTVDMGAFTQYDDGGNVTNNNTQINITPSDFTISSEANDGEDRSMVFVSPTSIALDSTSVTINGDAVATENYVDAAVSGKADTSAVTAISDSLSGYVQTSAITTSVTSGSTDSEIPTAKAVYDAIPTGGGATYSAGTNISIDTGNTISCTLPITANSSNSIAVGGSSSHLGQLTCFTLGQNENKSRQNGVAAARQCSIKNIAEAAFGSAPNTVGNYTGDTYFRGRQDATLFTVGNGDTNFGGRHNALEIRQNGDIYFPDTDNTTYANYYQKPMIRLQDIYAALGGLKFMQCTQAYYDSLVSGGTVDSSTIYFITNVVS